MKIAFFTEMGFNGKIPRKDPNLRVPQSWMVALEAMHYRLGSPISEEYDLGIIIIPKNLIDFDLNAIKSKCKKVAFMQEGPHWYFQDYPLEKQIWFFNMLQEMDFLFVHNESDVKYYHGLTGKDCKVMPSVMIEDCVKEIEEVERKDVIIGGNFCNWYGGFDSYIVACTFGTKIHIPSMGRKIDGEEGMHNLHHLPYMNWSQWINELNKFKYAIHLMRTHAAGTFALNCAYLGIPCIGYEGLDTQEICHPLTTVKIGDLSSAREMAKKLKENEDFYNLVSNLSKEKYAEKFSEDKYVNTIKGALN